MQADIFHGEQGIPDDDVGAFLQKRPICWCAGSGGVLCAAAAAWQEGSETHWGRLSCSRPSGGGTLGRGWRGSRLTTCLRWALTASTWTPARRRVRIVCGMGGQDRGRARAAFYRGTVTPVVLERHAYRAI